ncbi:MAG TPA: amidase [Casimicrobiaceae bacterium]|nr:amidase [Casimicrobiaceae bacterium]
MSKPRLPNELGVVEAASAIRSGALRSRDLVEACLARIEAREGTIGAWAYLDVDAARNAAAARDREAPRGLLHGVPIAVKDIIDTADMPTEYGSPVYRGYCPARDAACVTSMKRAGAVILGKTVTTEFAYFAPGKTANPRNPAHTPGGSSSGSAAAVADCMVTAAFGTQTAASITRPASFCGIVGYKPTFGSFDLRGIRPFAESFDTLGLLARSVEDVRYLRCALRDEPFDARAEMPYPRIALCRTPWWHEANDDCRSTVERAARALERLGAIIVDARLPEHFAGLAELHREIMVYEGARNCAEEFAEHRDELSDTLAALIEQGMKIDHARYEAACAEAAQVRSDFAAWMRRFDLVLAPSAKGEAPRGLASTGDPLMSRLWTLLRVPSLTLPGFVGAHGLPIGVQLTGAYQDDDRLLRWAAWVEAEMFRAAER